MQINKGIIASLLICLFLIGFALGMFAEYSRNWSNNERLFALLKSSDINEQACAEIAIRRGEPYDWEFISTCLEYARDMEKE